MYLDSIVCDKQTLSVFLKSVLCASGVQQKELSTRLGVDSSHICRMLNGSNITIDTFFTLLDALDVQCILVYDREFAFDLVSPSLPLPNSNSF